MAHLGRAEAPRQHQLAAVAAQVAGTEPDRECLAVPARQLVVQPRVRLRPRHRRSLLRRGEQTDRSALDHHVHRPEGLGPWVIVIERWYKSVETTTKFYSGMEG